jgi:hypothetical protein
MLHQFRGPHLSSLLGQMPFGIGEERRVCLHAELFFADDWHDFRQALKEPRVDPFSAHLPVLCQHNTTESSRQRVPPYARPSLESAGVRLDSLEKDPGYTLLSIRGNGNPSLSIRLL